MKKDEMNFEQILKLIGLDGRDVFKPDNSFADKVRVVVDKNGKKLVVKVCSNKEKFEHEIKALDYYSKFINVPKPLAKFEFEKSNLYVFVMSFIEGITYDEYSEMEKIEKLAFDYGKILGTLHKIKPLDDFGSKEDWSQKMTGLVEVGIERLDKIGYNKTRLEKLKVYFSKHSHFFTPDILVPLHYDYRPGNVMIQNNQVVGLIDFESSPNGDPIYDFVKFFNVLKSQQTREFFLSGYQTEMNLPKLFNQKLEFCTILNSFINLSWLSSQNRSKDDEYFIENEKRLADFIF